MVLQCNLYVLCFNFSQEGVSHHFELETDRYHFLKATSIIEVKYQLILSGISYPCKVRICVLADLQKAKYQSNLQSTLNRLLNIG